MKQKNKKKRNVKSNKYRWKWITAVFFLSFVITVVLSALSASINISDGRGFLLAGIVLMSFIVIGVVFDIIALAIATADEKPFHSMAAHGIKSAKYAIKLIRNAEKITNFFSDVIGDIAGIVSGSTGIAIAAGLFLNSEREEHTVAAGLILTGLIAAMTVGGKAFGKGIAINHNTKIVNAVSKIMYFFSRKR